MIMKSKRFNLELKACMKLQNLDSSSEIIYK
jgi:hypothetical protein